jgi:hypothetical protein
VEGGREMNPDNYASLEASRRLHEKGIVTETEAMWEYDDPCSDPSDPAWNQYGSWTLVNKPYKIGQMHNRQVSAPSLTEIWRELPERIIKDRKIYRLTMYRYADSSCVGYISLDAKIIEDVHNNINPADAAIDLLIWVTQRKEATDAK